MMLEGTVTNVAAFGAFVDVGVHQDGLVHVSQIADRFVKDPSDIVKAGDVVQVQVVEVDIPRKRISLTMRKDGGVGSPPVRQSEGRGPESKGPEGKGRGGHKPHPKPSARDTGGGALAAALAEAMRKR
jgi:uncharacterized protein